MPNRSDPSKKLKVGDYVEVLVPLGKDADGNTTYEKGIVSRAGLSDEKWADVKARAEASGRLSTVKESEKTRGGSSDVEGDAIRFKDKSGGTVVVPRGDLDESAWMQRISDAADKDSFESATLGGEPMGAGPNRAKRVGTNDLADEGATPVEAKQTLIEPAGQASGARKFFGDAVKGALPGPPGMGTPPGPIPEGQGSLLDALPAPKGHEIPAPIPVPDFGTAEGTSQALGGPYAASPTDAVKKLGANTLGPSPGAQMGDLVEAGRQSLQQPTPVPPVAPAPAPQPQPISTEMKMQVRGGPSSAPGVAPSLDQAEKDFMAGQQQAVETAGKGAAEKLQARAKYEADAAAFEAAQLKAQSRQREQEDRVNSAYLQTLDELSKKQQIDPDHFWDSKSTGQKAFMAIGGFLAGLGGRDPSGRIDQMIAQDIAVQRENFNLAREGAKNKLAGLNTMYGRLRERGLDDREAAAGARAAMNEGFARRLESISEQMAPGEAQSKAQLAISQFRMNKAKAQEDMMMGAAQRAHMLRQDDMQSFELGMKAKAAAEKASAGTKIPATLAKDLSELKDTLASIDSMGKASEGGFFKRGAIDAANTIPGGGALFPDMKARAQEYSSRRAVLLKQVLGALTNADYQTALSMMPEKISAMEDPAPYLARAADYVRGQIARREADYGLAGPDTRGVNMGGVEEQSGP